MFWFCFLSNSDGETALTSKEGHKEVVERLLSAGADVNRQRNVCDIL